MGRRADNLHFGFLLLLLFFSLKPLSFLKKKEAELNKKDIKKNQKKD